MSKKKKQEETLETFSRNTAASSALASYTACKGFVEEPIEDVLTDLLTDLWHTYPQHMERAIRLSEQHYLVENQGEGP